jgi:hypothetical protein
MADSEDDQTETVLSPDELDFTDDEHVAEVEDNRFVVSPDDPIEDEEAAVDVPDEPVGSGPDPVDEPTADSVEESMAFDAVDVHEWLGEQLTDTGARYGFDVTVMMGKGPSSRRFASDDVVTTFETLLRWAAAEIDDETPIEEVLGILLVEANVGVRFPPESVRGMLDHYDLEPSDDIASLVAAGDGDGLVVPPARLDD